MQALRSAPGVDSRLSASKLVELLPDTFFPIGLYVAQNSKGARP